MRRNFNHDGIRRRPGMARQKPGRAPQPCSEKKIYKIELGAYGAPETFIIDAKGIIRYKRVGEVNERIWSQELWPRIQKLRAKTRTEPTL